MELACTALGDTGNASLARDNAFSHGQPRLLHNCDSRVAGTGTFGMPSQRHSRARGHLDDPESKGAVSLAIYEELLQRYNGLRGRYEDLEREHARCKSYIAKANAKYSAAKASAREWRLYIDTHRIPVKETKVSSSTARRSEPVEDDQTPRPRLKYVGDNRIDSPHIGAAKEVKSGSRPVSSASTTNSRTRKIEAGHEDAHGLFNVGAVPSSQTTEEELEPTKPTKQLVASDDEPKVAFTRPVKRRRIEPANAMPPPIIKQERLSQNEVIELSSEQQSSETSELAPKPRPLPRFETSDLDAVVEHLNTPQKRRHYRAVSEKRSRPLLLRQTTSSLSHGISESELPVPLGKATIGVGAESEVDVAVKQQPPLDRIDRTKQTKPLRELSVNRPEQPNAERSRIGVKRKSNGEEVRTKVEFLSEDGEQATSQVAVPKPSYAPNFRARARLDDLLDAASPDKVPLAKNLVPESATRDPRQAQIRKQKAATEVAVPTKTTPAVYKRPRGMEPSPPPPKPQDEPLRSRPRGALRLSDFKINPAFTGGADFAYTDTVRGREKRRCLKGCTKPECCGGIFRMAVAYGGAQRTDDDRRILEEYLGPRYAEVLEHYTPEKRQDVLDQARAFDFANKHGKHRHAFERHSTPPGFWRTDMPTTQEEEEDRAAALRKEKQVVEERWAQAMGQGRWLFRDE